MENDSTSRPRTELSQWVIYAHPRDYPDKYVMRRWNIYGDAMVPSDEMALADTLVEIRKCVPWGLFRLERFEDDDACIVEVWL